MKRWCVSLQDVSYAEIGFINNSYFGLWLWGGGVSFCFVLFCLNAVVFKYCELKIIEPHQLYYYRNILPHTLLVFKLRITFITYEKAFHFWILSHTEILNHWRKVIWLYNLQILVQLVQSWMPSCILYNRDIYSAWHIYMIQLFLWCVNFQM